MGKRLFVLILSVEDIGRFDHAVLLGIVMLVQELHGLGEIPLLDQADQLGSQGAQRLLTLLEAKDGAGVSLNLGVIIVSHSFH